MSGQPAGIVASALEDLEPGDRRHPGRRHRRPFMHLSFLGLSVIPQLRITDLGLVDVDRFALTSVAPG